MEQAKEDKLIAVLLLPSSPQNEMTRFAQIVESTIQQLNIGRVNNLWELVVLSRNTEGRSPECNYSILITKL